MYIKIWNKLPEGVFVNRLALEKLGLSTKRDNENTIGRFGSGIKFAPIAAIRFDSDFTFVGADTLGKFKLKYSVENELGIDCIVYDYGDYKKPSSFTTGAGEVSWIDPYQVLREPIANALDVESEYGTPWGWCYVDQIEDDLEDDIFAIYIKSVPHFVNIMDHYDEFFSNGRPIFFENHTQTSSNSVQVYKKIDGNDRLNVFCMGMLVHKTDPQRERSIFDYNFSGSLSLTEERTIRNVTDAYNNIGRVMRGASDEMIEFMCHEIHRMVLDLDYDDMDYAIAEFNSYVISWLEHQPDSTWDFHLKKLFGDDAVFVDADRYNNAVRTNLEMRKKKPIIINNEELYRFLALVGTTVEKVLGANFECEVDHNISKYPVLQHALRIASKFEPEINNYLDRFCVSLDENVFKGLVLHVSSNDDDKDDDTLKIAIAEEHITNSPLYDIVGTVIHEMDHVLTGCGDGYSSEGSQFRDIADRRIGQLMVQYSGKSPFFVWNGKIAFGSGELPNLPGSPTEMEQEYVHILKSMVVKFYDRTYVVKANKYFDFCPSSLPHYRWVPLDGINSPGLFVIDLPFDVESITMIPKSGV